MLRFLFIIALLVSLGGCVSQSKFDEYIANNDDLTAALKEQINGHTKLIGMQKQRIISLERELHGFSNFSFITIGNGDWHDAYANQSGTVKNVLVNHSKNNHSHDNLILDLRVLRITSDPYIAQDFPVYSDTAVVDTGPLDLKLQGSRRELKIPAGYRLIIRSNKRGINITAIIN